MRPLSVSPRHGGTYDAFDPIYWVIIAVGGLLSLITSAFVKSAFHKAEQVPIDSRLTGADVARRILSARDVNDVDVVEHPGFLSDHYNPMTKTLALSPKVFHGRTAAAAGVAAHEVGHAIQHAQGYSLMWFRSILVPVANIGSALGPILIIIGIVLAGASSATGQPHILAIIGVLMFGAATLFTLVTVPVEFDASRRATLILADMGIVRPGPEEAQVKRVLLAAGLTYVAAAIGAILHLVYWAYQAGLIGGGETNNRSWR